MKTVRCILFITCISTLALSACSKEWLSQPSDKSKFIPATLADAKALLDNESFLNTRTGMLEDAGADDYYLTYASWSTLTDVNKNLYTWNQDIFAGMTSTDWNNRYQKVFIANSALDILASLDSLRTDPALYRRILGTALFIRANSFLQVAQSFAPPYVKATAATDPGISLRLQADINATSVRSSVEQTYQQIITDARTAAALLTALPEYPTKPSRLGAYGLLARTYLFMQEYDSAGAYANRYLSLQHKLVDYKTLSTTAANPIRRFNEEVAYHERSLIPAWFATSRCRVDTTLYRSYDNFDLRRVLFYRDNGVNGIAYKGSYDGSTFAFSGIATDEQYLIRSECHARKGETTAAIADLDTLLRYRFAQGKYVPYVFTTEQALLQTILQERRKELVFRNIRWSDLRRNNLQSGLQTTLKRVLNNTEYLLLPGSNRYVLPIPDDVIALTGMTQNNRE